MTVKGRARSEAWFTNRPRASLVRLVRQLDELPGGSVVSVVAPIGSDQDELVRLWDRYGSLRPRKLLPASPGESLFDGLIRTLDTLKGVALDRVRDLDGLLPCPTSPI